MVTENQVLIEEMLRNAESVEEPGAIARQRVIYQGDEETPPMVATKVQSAGWVRIYDTKTGESSLTNRNMLVMQLKKSREDGSPVFTTVKPNIVPFRGAHKCMLHPDDPNRSHYDEFGLPKCPKDNIPSPHEVILHMKKKHKMEWQIIEAEKIAAEKLEERKFRRDLLKRTKKAEA